MEFGISAAIGLVGLVWWITWRIDAHTKIMWQCELAERARHQQLIETLQNLRLPL